jgi:two-component system NarL family sensor kinase
MTILPASRDHRPVRRGVTGPGLATWAWVAVVVAILNGVGLAAALIVGVATHEDLKISESGAWINLIAAPTFPLLAALMFRSRGRDPLRPPRLDRLAWLFVVFGTVCAGTVVLHVLSVVGFAHQVPGTIALAWVSSWFWTAVAPGLLLSVLWFPTGEVPGPRWRWAERGVALAYAGMWVSIAFDPGRMTDFPGNHVNPLGWESAQNVLKVTSVIGFGTLALTAIATVVSVIVRFRRGNAEVRAQLRWLLAIVLLIALTIVVPRSVLPSVNDALAILGTALLPVTLAVALTRRDGYGLPRVLVYGALSTVLLAGYLAIVAGAQAVFGTNADRAAAVGAAGVVAVLAAPLRLRLQRAVDRLIYGDRGDPHAALSDLGRRIAGSPDDLLREVVGTVTDALRAPYAAIVLAGDSEPTAVAGTPSPATVAVPLSLRGTEVGSLVVAQRSPVEPYGARDFALLEELARHIAVAAHAATLTRDLQRSRESLVVTREEERRRIRRDLHDGLGPALAGVAFGLDAARNTLAQNPSAADAALAELKTELLASLADVRRLVYDLRPPALDQLGLVPALQEYAARLGERGALQVSVTASALPPLPAAIEVATYRIATEALTNAARHSGARHSFIDLLVDDKTLRLEVADDGVGVNGHRGNGVGLAAMAERAAELGGTCSVTKREEGGTTVVAVLPLRAAT